MAEFMGIIQHIGDMANIMQQHSQNSNQSGQLGGGNHNSEVVGHLREFLKMEPYSFHGEPDPKKVDKWLKKVKKIFDVLNTPFELGVSLAAYLFKGDADYWWDMIKRSYDVERMSWVTFEELFLDKYLGEALKDANIEKFL